MPSVPRALYLESCHSLVNLDTLPPLLRRGGAAGTFSLLLLNIMLHSGAVLSIIYKVSSATKMKFILLKIFNTINMLSSSFISIYYHITHLLSHPLRQVSC